MCECVGDRTGREEQEGCDRKKRSGGEDLALVAQEKLPGFPAVEKLNDRLRGRGHWYRVPGRNASRPLLGNIMHYHSGSV